ncbi:acetolactate synthase, regulatory subunit [Coemansia sp. RSA 2711]|nr:acetolactate synthase, regulatory subunit [Coemansia sp. RSA 2711]KAJ1844097.1 acetolactate synthase, regulatory subunit [Coemansia sp. RSA 2708]KAJ2311017.1 acetolactate synthase, regulatory subunit [Coemansia sp. RSA 2705]KAJ2318859.1 acetolactate synthase, regulatory subunit [Coemansia sp. RSA 2704]KAJ2366169.1 acetolactate synthase, regulatory subunit [Coemansia sp. RSA 2610]KAJ2387799.1 acetolactate synthase, regulatory subunit [Coemansia sp. RSA 2611]KAJ2735416.1 acetolactate synthas
MFGRVLQRTAPIGRAAGAAARRAAGSAASAGGKVNESATTAMEYKQQHPRQLRRLPRVDSGSSAAEQAVSNILYNTPTAPKLQTERHILDCLAQDEPGVLSRVTGVMAARGFNIDTLVASKTEVPGLSRMTLVLKGPAIVMEQAKKQLEDLVPIWAVLDYSHTRIIERESLLVKVSIAAAADAPAEGDAQFLDAQERLRALRQLADLFKGHVLDVGPSTAVVSLNAKGDRIDAFLKLVRPFGILEAVRSGIMAMPRAGSVTMFESEQSAPHASISHDDQPDLSNLPPS